MTAFKGGMLITAGLVGHKVLTGLLRDLVFKPAVETVAETAASNGESTSGLGQLKSYGGLIVGAGVAIGGIMLASRMIKDEQDRKLVVGGIAASFIHTAIVSLLDIMGQPEAATMLAGVDDGTAARISAMYGLGAGASIMPRYTPVGEYFASGTNGMGEYFDSGVQGLGRGMGEYFASGTNGLGALQPYEASAGVGDNYGVNPDMYQAAAGVGASTYQGNHIDPSSDLDRELTIAEAAAGVGASVYQAAAGFGQASIQTVPTANTWIPGMSDGPLWAGTRPVSEPQSAHEMLPAGILQTDGGSGVFGRF